MGLEYRGSRVSEDQDIIRLLDARAKASQVTNPDDAQELVNSSISDLASKSYVDSAFNNYATQADVDAAYANKAQASILGESLLQLDDTRRIAPSALPNLTTRGARWVNGGAINDRDNRLMNIDDGGWLNTAVSMASLTVTGSSMGNRPYYVLGFGQIEVKGNHPGAIPQVYISTNAALGFGNYIAIGQGMPSWLDYYHLSITPASRHSNATSTFTGNTTFYLSCRGENSIQGATSDFGAYMGHWGVLAIPMY